MFRSHNVWSTHVAQETSHPVEFQGYETAASIGGTEGREDDWPRAEAQRGCREIQGAHGTSQLGAQVGAARKAVDGIKIVRPSTPTTLHRDWLGLDTGFTTDPIVWLTINPILDLTVAAKMTLAGWPEALLNDIWRIILPRDYAPH